MAFVVGETITSVVGVGVGVRGLRVGRRVGVEVNVAVAVAVNVGVGVLVAVAVAVAVGVDVDVAVNVAVGGPVTMLALGVAGTPPSIELFRRSLMMKPANKAINATKPIVSGTRHDRRLICTGRTGGAIELEADDAFIITAAGAATTARSECAAASRSSSNSSVLPYRSAGGTAKHFCTICSMKLVMSGFQRRSEGGAMFNCSHNTFSRAVPALSLVSPVKGRSPPVSISNKTMPSA